MKSLYIYILIPFLVFHVNMLPAGNDNEGMVVRGSKDLNWTNRQELPVVSPKEVDFNVMAPEPVITLKSLTPLIPDEAIEMVEVETNPEIQLKDLVPVIPDVIEEVDQDSTGNTMNLNSLIPEVPDPIL